MSIKVCDGADAIRFLAYFITRTCEDMFDKMFKDLEMHEKERCYEQDYNETSFMWSVYGQKPRQIIMIKVEDAFGDNRVLVDPVFFYDPGMFGLRKPICFNIQFDEKDRRFKFEIFGGKWGPKLDKVDLDPFNDPYGLHGFDELMDLYKQLKTIVGNVNFNLEFIERVDVEDESAEEAEEETPVEESDETPEEQPVHKMRRFAGMMPVDEIERTEIFKDKYNHEVRIDAGPNGWTVRYADMSSNYKDESIGTDANFKNAYDTAATHVGPLTPVKTKRKEEEE